jgi:nitrile hydratase accessory protein
LLENAPAAIAELGYTIGQGEHMVVLENASQNPQHGCLYFVFVLSVARSRTAACLVQVGSLSVAGGHRPARRSARIWSGTARRCGSPENGYFTWKEWAAALADELNAAAERGEPDDGLHYYEHWLTALERMVALKGLSDAGALT